ncbi:uncharacterized protein [Euwallacea fornicatus]|uniref:uncharacterized protein n=1 Tax=Euwallacea fornicatus TaxID=995702 RepID=UPI00338F184E
MLYCQLSTNIKFLSPYLCGIPATPTSQIKMDRESMPTSSAHARKNDQSQSALHRDNKLSVENIHKKITEFSHNLSFFRLELLNCNPKERESLRYSLGSLRKSIELTLTELGGTFRNRTYNFKCGLCNEEILVNPYEDIWSCLQGHDHFEELYCQFLTNTLNIQPITENMAFTTFENKSTLAMEDISNTGNSNYDSGFEQHDSEPSVVSALIPPSFSENVNSFRFNFNISYDEEVENTIYPSMLMSGVRKYDKVKEFTIIKISNNKAACLLCSCDLNGLKISKYLLVSHAMGQKHLNCAKDIATLEILKTFHEFWMKQEAPIQAHQVYFKPVDSTKFKCSLCYVSCLKADVLAHITIGMHRKKIKEMYEKRINAYYLVNLQVQVYGISKSEVIAREALLKRQEEAKKVRGANNLNLTPDATPDNQLQRRSVQIPAKHSIIKAVEKDESMNPIEQLPYRMKRYASQLSWKDHQNGSLVTCNLCQCELQGSVLSLKNHFVSSPKHKKIHKLNYKYYCEICNVKMYSEGDWISHNFNGTRHKAMAPKRISRVAEYECTTCNLVIFGDDVSLSRHLQAANVRTRREKSAKLSDLVTKLLDSKEQIIQQAALMAKNADNVLTNSSSRYCCQKLQSALAEIDENCKVYPFGSRISGIGNQDSDLDVFVEVAGSYFGQKNQDPAGQVTIIRKAYKILSKDKDYANLVQVLTARTPILRLLHVPTNLACDLSFKHGLSVENTKFLRLCMELQPVCQQLILLIKKWVDLVVYENITTYAFAIMCIFYLQVIGYLPSIKRIRELNVAEHKVISGWETINYVLSTDEMKSYIKTYEFSVYELLQDFFMYYSKFDFNSYVVCPLLGEPFKRSLFFNEVPENFPPEMNAYVAQLKGEDPEIFRFNSYMCVQDPFDLSHNLTKAVQRVTLVKFQNMCMLSLAHIEAAK